MPNSEFILGLILLFSGASCLMLGVPLALRFFRPFIFRFLNLGLHLGGTAHLFYSPTHRTG